MSDRGQGAVFDLRYQRFTERRLGRRGATTATYRHGLRAVLGLRRKARRKVLPAILIAMAVIPALVTVGINVIAGEIEIDLVDHAGYFNQTAFPAFIFIGLAAPILLVPDRTYGVLQVYSSRPLQTNDYLAARLAALATVVFGFFIIPQLVLLIGNAIISDDWIEHLRENWELIWQVPLVTAGFFTAIAAPAFAIAAYARNANLATGIYLGLLLISSGMARGLVEGGDIRWAAFLGLAELPYEFRDWVFDERSEQIITQAGFEPWTSAVAILAMGVLSTALVVRRYQKLA